MQKIIKIIGLASLGLCIAVFASASEITGTLNTGLGGNNGGMNGIVVVAPAASPASGTYATAQSITLTASGSTSIHYTVDGSDPSCTTGTVYTVPIVISANTTIKGISCYPNNIASTVAAFSYVITSPSPGNPVAAPAAGTYASTQNVTLSAAGSTSIVYTVNGSTPTCLSGTTYSGAISVSSSETINAIACNAGNSSSVVSFAYTINSGGGNNGGGGGGNNGGGGGNNNPPPTCTKITGDINGDGIVDEYDFSIMMDAWGQTGTNTADLTKDSIVDEFDFSILMDNWGHTGPACQ